jgi:hypothetical protein
MPLPLPISGHRAVLGCRGWGQRCHPQGASYGYNGRRPITRVQDSEVDCQVPSSEKRTHSFRSLSDVQTLMPDLDCNRIVQLTFPRSSRLSDFLFAHQSILALCSTDHNIDGSLLNSSLETQQVILQISSMSKFNLRYERWHHI